MSDYAIQVENLSKRYKIGKRERYRMLRDVLADTVRSTWRSLRTALTDRTTYEARHANELIWALKDVSFNVREGDSIGIIGSNGAGKSTLLKILARVTVPTRGRVRLRGRVGSLLEVGTGFHPELTGRDNVYLNGAILGMRKQEIERKFDEIVAFSEIEKYLDTPVKFYSSGMRMRLAFSVAAHLEPEILLVDEVLAVGDIAFQNKCLNKMGEVTRQGRTVLFISHNMGAIKALCNTAVYLENGEVKYHGAVERAIQQYLQFGEVQRAASQAAVEVDRSYPIQILSAAVVDGNDTVIERIAHDQSFSVLVQAGVWSSTYRNSLSIYFHNGDLDTVLASHDFEQDETNLQPRQPGIYSFRVRVPAPLLVPGNYRVSVQARKQSKTREVVIHGLDHVCPFEVYDNGSVYARSGMKWGGKIAAPLTWECVGVVAPEAGSPPSGVSSAED